MTITVAGTTVTFNDSTTQSTAARVGTTATSTSADLTLTNTSTALQRVAFTAANKRVILPDASTMGNAVGPNIFQIEAGPSSAPGWLAISTGLVVDAINPPQHVPQVSQPWGLDGAGALPAAAPYRFNAGASKGISLSSLSTNQSGWGYSMGYNLASDISIPVAPSQPTGYVATTQLAQLTTTTYLAVFTTTNANTYACVGTVSGTTWTWGTATLVNGSFYPWSLVGLSSTTAFCYLTAGASNLIYPISVSGTTVTVGTSVNLGNVGSVYLSPRNSTTAIVNYGNAGQTVRLVTYNGASAPTLGTTASLPAAVTASGARCAGPVNSNVFIFSGLTATSPAICAVDFSTATPTVGSAVYVNTALGLVGLGMNGSSSYTPWSGAASFYTNAAGTEGSICYGYGQQVFTVSGTTLTAGLFSAYPAGNKPTPIGMLAIAAGDYVSPTARFGYVNGVGLVQNGPPYSAGTITKAAGYSVYGYGANGNAGTVQEIYNGTFGGGRLFPISSSQFMFVEDLYSNLTGGVLNAYYFTTIG